METQHTPGPWKVDFTPGQPENLRTIRNGENIYIAEVADAYGYSEHTEANARLIALAPEMLEALQQAAFAIPTTHAAFDTVRAAIAKATQNGDTK